MDERRLRGRAIVDVTGHNYIIYCWPEVLPKYFLQHQSIIFTRDLLRWVYSLLSSGLLSSAPTLPSNEESIFSETGTNREVSGGLGVELSDEKFLKQIPESACCFLCTDTTPWDAWLLPTQVQAARELMWRWSRENNSEQRVADMAASCLSGVLACPQNGKQNKRGYHFGSMLLSSRDIKTTHHKLVQRTVNTAFLLTQRGWGPFAVQPLTNMPVQK